MLNSTCLKIKCKHCQDDDSGLYCHKPEGKPCPKQEQGRRRVHLLYYVPPKKVKPNGRKN